MRAHPLALAFAVLPALMTLVVCAERPSAQRTPTPEPTLAVRDGACVVTAFSHEIVLKPQPPCFFVRDETGRIQTHQRRDAARTTLILVGGTPLARDPDPVPAGVGPCGSEVQAVAIAGQSARALPRIGRGSRICAAQGGVDATYFEIFDR